MLKMFFSHEFKLVAGGFTRQWFSHRPSLHPPFRVHLLHLLQEYFLFFKREKSATMLVMWSVRANSKKVGSELSGCELD